MCFDGRWERADGDQATIRARVINGKDEMNKKQQAMNSAQKSTQAESKPDRLLTHRRSRAERRAMGKKLRDACPREAHAHWKAPAGRPDPVSLVLEADKGRLPELLPLRHGRMALLPSPFTGDRRSTWRWTSRKLQPRASACNAAETPTWAISAAWVLRRGASSSPSTTWMKPCPLRGSGTSSVLRRASWSPAGTIT